MQFLASRHFNTSGFLESFIRTCVLTLILWGQVGLEFTCFLQPQILIIGCEVGQLVELLSVRRDVPRPLGVHGLYSTRKQMDTRNRHRATRDVDLSERCRCPVHCTVGTAKALSAQDRRAEASSLRIAQKVGLNQSSRTPAIDTCSLGVN